MEVTFKNLLHAYNGKCDGIVYYYNKRMGKVIARRHSGNCVFFLTDAPKRD